MSCSIEGCNKVANANKLCDMHRKRLERHGDPNAGRPDDWGDRHKHPLYETWKWMRRMGVRYNMSEEWRGDFWEFVEDMGDRPSPSHRLSRINRDFGYSKDNCVWKDTMGVSSANKSEYMREYRKQNPDKMKAIDLKRMYGISVKDYLKMWKSQNACCAICGEKESEVGTLAVDHNHTTKEFRGLLCSQCNRSLGGFKDSIPILANATKYLQKAPVVGGA